VPLPYLFAQAVHLPPSSDENADRALSPEGDGLGVAAASQAARHGVNDKPSVAAAPAPQVATPPPRIS